LKNKNVSYCFIFILLFAVANCGLAYGTDITLSSKEHYNKINEYLSIAKSELRTDAQASMEAARQAKKLSLDFDENKLLASNLSIAQVYQQKGSLDTALLIINDALELATRLQNDTLKAEAYHILGINHQLFHNIIENSIKYNTSQTPTVKISAKENQDFLSVFVEDNGIGIDKKYHNEIFVMFSRLHNQDEYKGSGLGLSIGKKIVNKLDGEIYVHSAMIYK